MFYYYCTVPLLLFVVTFQRDISDDVWCLGASHFRQMQSQPLHKVFRLDIARPMLQALSVLVKNLDSASSEAVGSRLALRARQQDLHRMLICSIVGHHDESTNQMRQHIQELQGFSEEMPPGNQRGLCSMHWYNSN